MKTIVVGAGIGGLTLALMLERIGLGGDLRVYEAVRELKPLGVGINLQPHAVRELDALGLVPALRATSVEAKEFAFFTARGQHVYSEPCGLYAGYAVPHFSIHRGDLQRVLLDAVRKRLGDGAVVCGHRCVGIGQDGGRRRGAFRRPRRARVTVRSRRHRDRRGRHPLGRTQAVLSPGRAARSSTASTCGAG